MTERAYIKAVREGYSPPPFFYREEYQTGATRWVVWTSDLEQLKRVFYHIVTCFPDEIAALLKVEGGRETKPSADPWKRFHGVCSLDNLLSAIRDHEQLVFQDGGSQLCIRCAGGGDYIALDEHGIVFLYSDANEWADVLRGEGFQEQVQPLLYEQGHWHVRPPNASEEGDRLITRLGLAPV